MILLTDKRRTCVFVSEDNLIRVVYDFIKKRLANTEERKYWIDIDDEVRFPTEHKLSKEC